MLTSKQEIVDALNHEEEMLKLRRKNLRKLELQDATYGLETPVHITNQMELLVSQIRRHEEEINRLQTLSVEDQIPVNEAEYRVILAKSWNTPLGQPTYTGQVRLEFARLRLHIAPEKAKTLELEVRKGLAHEVYAHLDFDLVQTHCVQFCAWLIGGKDVTWESVSSTPSMKEIRKIIRLDVDMALFLLIEDTFFSIDYGDFDMHRLCMLFSWHRPHNEYNALIERLSSVPVFDKFDIPKIFQENRTPF